MKDFLFEDFAIHDIIKKKTDKNSTVIWFPLYMAYVLLYRILYILYKATWNFLRNSFFTFGVVQCT